MTEQFWSKEFPITSVTRADLVSAGFSKKLVKAITDEEMQQIASKMEDYWCDGSYWDDLKVAVIAVAARESENNAGD